MSKSSLLLNLVYQKDCYTNKHNKKFNLTALLLNTIARGFTKKSNFLPFSPSSNSEKSENSLHSTSLLYGILSFVKQENNRYKNQKCQ